MVEIEMKSLHYWTCDKQEWLSGMYMENLGANNFQVVEFIVMLATTTPLAISNWAIGILAALIFGSIILVVRYGRQCCDSIAWIIEMYRMYKINTGLETPHKEQMSDVGSSVKESNKKEIAEIKRQISILSRQIKAIFVEIKKTRRTELLKALKVDANAASTEYGMKFELKRSEFDKAMKALQVTLAKMPEQAVTYRQNTIKWIANAHKKFDKYSPEKFVQKVEAAKSKHKTIQNK
ncbi:MAG: hypothetical protein JXM79_20225 [Sedimentisphaerales bacterium]|nr:hypothetical protein [Sedimentisphaerales bacterium]